MKKTIAAASAAGALFLVGAAAAHPEAALLTTRSDVDRAVAGPGVTIEEIAGVHLYEGAPRLAGGEADAPAPAPAPQRIEIVIRRDYVLREFRPLRTQGFYSGYGQKSRRFTQGFFSGGPE